MNFIASYLVVSFRTYFLIVAASRAFCLASSIASICAILFSSIAIHLFNNAPVLPFLPLHFFVGV
jgi:hypothetical protein